MLKFTEDKSGELVAELVVTKEASGRTWDSMEMVPIAGAFVANTAAKAEWFFMHSDTSRPCD